ncbi:MAG: TIM barrel protein [Terriglobia bacterium]|jgi:sugar phosphate isomerase/epimerase
MEIALSSGCIVRRESQIAHSGIRAVELSGHHVEQIDYLLGAIEASGARILSIHCPCPSRGFGLNPGAQPAAWKTTEHGLLEAAELAKRWEAKYVLVHAFYSTSDDLPADDISRMEVLSRLSGGGGSIAEYICSESYALAKARTITNLKSLVPRFRRDFPGQKIILENLNPRIGYGGIRFQDVVDVAEALDGEVGICLDLGHLTLAAAVLGDDMEKSVRKARALILSIHAHDNFAGRFCVDRNWDTKTVNPTLQDVDIHLPFLTRYRRSVDVIDFRVLANNSAFVEILKGGAHYAGDGDGEILKGDVPIERWLALVPDAANLVLEFDSRYAPLQEVFEEYHLARTGRHPRI